ncbi:MAG: FAD-binding protein [Chloroflexi bacterium]|nr:FAD-binding protein [Chloroflexota bacterium]
MTAGQLTAAELTALGADIARRVGVKAERDAPLARFTTMRVGGRADLLVTAHNAFELRALVRFARSRDLPLFVLGRGSNVIISEHGVRGVVVHVRAEGTWLEGERYRAEAGVPMARASARSSSRPTCCWRMAQRRGSPRTTWGSATATAASRTSPRAARPRSSSRRRSTSLRPTPARSRLGSTTSDAGGRLISPSGCHRPAAPSAIPTTDRRPAS